MATGDHNGERIKVILAGLLLVSLVVLVLAFLTGGGRERIRQTLDLPAAPRTAGPGAAPVRRVVALYFMSDDDDRLHPEEREIVAGPPAEEAAAIVNELLAGPRSGLIAAIPAETKLNQLFITKEGTAYVDLSKDIQERILPGSSSEICAVYSIVDTLTQNIKAVKNVFILVDGQERDTLAGHVNLELPLAPDPSLIAR
jgi:spore germination protein GerM